MLEIREIKISDIEKLNLYKEKFLRTASYIDGASGLSNSDTKDWVENLELYKSKDTVPNNFVPAHTFIAIKDNKIVGIINARHELNEYLANFGGHIGYSVSPSERKKGYAKQMVLFALDFYKNELNKDKVLLTCDKENIASKKTIIACGGILENCVKEDDSFTERYWINLSE